MSKKGLTEIIAIIDKSGSMGKLKSRTIEGFNTFLKEQKELEGEARFSLILFSSKGYEKIIYDSIDIQKVDELTDSNYICGGTTALYDAIGKTIKAQKDRIKTLSEEEKPKKILVIVLTDGEENDSGFYDKDKVFKMIKKKEEKGWVFLYLGANQDSFVEGGKIGIKRGQTLNYSATSDGMDFAYKNIRAYTVAYRNADTETAKNLSFSDLNIDDTAKSTDDKS